MKKTVQCGFRVSEEEFRILERIKRETGIKRISDVLRYLIGRESVDHSSETNKKLEMLLNKMDSQTGSLHREFELIQFVAFLLTAFVQKNSRNDPNAGEQMINRARVDAKNNNNQI